MRWSIDAISCFAFLMLSLLSSAQNVEVALARWVASGTLTPTEAEALELHLLAHGFPIAVEEAAAVVGVSSSAAQKLMNDPEWKQWASTPMASNRSKLHVQWNAAAWLGVSDSSQALGPPTSVSLRAERPKHWGLRCDRGMGENGVDHVSGFVALPSRSGYQWLFGDHTLRWGQGLVSWSPSAYDGLRSAAAIQLVPHPLRPVMAGDAMKVRRGVAVTGSLRGGEIVGSLDASAVECQLQDGEVLTWYRDGQHRTDSERNRIHVRPVRIAGQWQKARVDRGWGTAFELGRLNPADKPRWNGIAGVNGHFTAGRSRWAGELAASPKSISWSMSAIWTWSKSWDAFFGWHRFPASHPGMDWGDVWKVDGEEWVWGISSNGPIVAHHAQWNWDGEQLKWQWQVKAKLLEVVQGTLRLQGSPHGHGDTRTRSEIAWQSTIWSAKAWLEWQCPSGFAGGMSWSFQSRERAPKWKLGWSQCELTTGQNVYILEPNAASWQTTVLSGKTNRFWAVTQWKWGQSFTIACSGSNGYRADEWSWPEGGPWVWKGNSRWEFRIRLAYAL